MRFYDGELCDCGCSLMETSQGLFCPECGKLVTEWENVLLLLAWSVVYFQSQ